MAGLYLCCLLLLMQGCKKAEPLTSEENAPAGSAQLKVTSKQESAQVVYDWYKYIAQIQRPVNPQPSPLAMGRIFSYVGVGLYESVQSGIPGARSLSHVLYQMPAMPKPDMSKDYLWGEAANAVLASLFKQLLPGLSPANIASIDAMELAKYNAFRATTSEDVMIRSQDYGRSIANAIVAWAATDNFNLSSAGYVFPPATASTWEPTPPAFAPPTGAFLGTSRPMIAYSITALAPPIPIPFSTTPGSAFYEAVNEVYQVGVGLTATQKGIASWWADAGGVGVGLPPPYHLLAIITKSLETVNAGLAKAAEVYAKTGIGMKDGPIITFRSKYHYNLIRPITYIRRHINSSWLSFLPTPPYPEYTSGLVSLYGPPVQVLIRELGDMPFSDDAYAWRGDAPRSYASLTALITEAARSRVYGGLHYQFTQDITVAMTKELGDKIADLQIVGPKY